MARRTTCDLGCPAAARVDPTSGTRVFFRGD